MCMCCSAAAQPERNNAHAADAKRGQLFPLGVSPRFRKLFPQSLSRHRMKIQCLSLAP
jgi:hypothetical protein